MQLQFDSPVDGLHPFRLTALDRLLVERIANARTELAHKVQTLSDGQSATWGFFPELHPEEADYPACVALKSIFDQQFLQLAPLQPFALKLAFIRLATSEPQSSFGGLHIDASAGIDHLPPKERPAEHDGILRILINLYDEAPRKLAYSVENIDSLRQQGVSIPADHYEIVKLPAGMPLQHYLVPAAEPDCLHGVMFESSSVLHAGQTNQKGHFLLSYGGYANTAELRRSLLA